MGWSKVRCCGCGVVIGKMLRVWGGQKKDVVGVVWLWVRCCVCRVVMGKMLRVWGGHG